MIVKVLEMTKTIKENNHPTTVCIIQVLVPCGIGRGLMYTLILKYETEEKQKEDIEILKHNFKNGHTQREYPNYGKFGIRKSTVEYFMNGTK